MVNPSTQTMLAITHFQQYLSQASRSLVFSLCALWIYTDPKPQTFLLLPFALTIEYLDPLLTQPLTTALFANLLLAFRLHPRHCYQKACHPLPPLEPLIVEAPFFLLPIVCPPSAIAAAVTLEFHLGLTQREPALDLGRRGAALIGLSLTKLWVHSQLRDSFIALKKVPVPTQASIDATEAIELLGRVSRPQFRMGNSRRILGSLLSRAYGHPSSSQDSSWSN
eukprot:Protomagalhaensia_sp_Gyna_25__5560@NODE_759_length_2681_cov_81_228993_g595_i0_p2_GENE_NODE_759_length_2681_cov_81_228993_g595_i0NODE_759_length_2681_cov_81_228993_g595_i0_p2_ORF_typecomplete_len223_score37_27_NODE_759_length_2681_cov_81_228993_g595_i019752643